MTITEVAIHDIERISVPDLHDRIRRSVSLVRGDFRQDDILAGWKEVLHNREDDELQVVRMTVHCNAGTYLRSLADVMGRSLGTGGTLLELRRTHVGRWHVGASDVIRSGHLNN